MTDGPDGPKRRSQGSGKSSGADGSKSGESSSDPKRTAKSDATSNAGSSTQQSATASGSGSAAQQSADAGSGSTSQQPEAGNSGGHGDGAEASQSGSTNLQADLELTRACEAHVESFRRGQVARGATLLAIASALRGATLAGTKTDAVDAAFESFCAQVDEIAKYRAENQPDDGHDPTQDGQADDPDARGGSSQMLSQSKGKEKARRRRSRSRSHASSRDGNASNTTLEDEQPASKKFKQDPKRFAWSKANAVAETSLRPELQETLELIRNHDYDIKTARSSLRNSVSVPEFPDAEWTNVLLGKPVDLNHVLSGQYTLEQDEKTVQKLGLVELTYRTSAPSRVVKNAGDWLIAWQRMVTAVLYVFPHRRAELDGYYLHIFGLFSAILPTHHIRIIDYDRAVRKRVGSMHTLLLTDTDKFSDLRDRFINTFGVSTDNVDEEGKKRGAGNRRTRSEEACRRWNRGTCDAADGACKYAHKCSACGARDHLASRCDKNPKRKS